MPVSFLPQASGPTPKGGTTPVNLLRSVDGDLSAHEDALATEEPLEIQLSYERRGGTRVNRSVSVTMRTPGNDAELAAGFLFGEGLICDRTQIAEIVPVTREDGGPLNANTIRVCLSTGVEVDLRALERHFYTTSSCGVCGKTSIEALSAAREIRLPPGEPRVPLSTLVGLPDLLRRTQSVFERTGGLHGAGLFGAAGELVLAREDVGRHNAVDKVIGAQLLAGATPLGNAVLVVSGRASFELIQKALMAGIPIFVAVGAPSSLAVDLARQFGATLLGFARGGRVNVYSGAQRLAEAAQAPVDF
jgi:FdhD protein